MAMPGCCLCRTSLSAFVMYRAMLLTKPGAFFVLLRRSDLSCLSWGQGVFQGDSSSGEDDNGNPTKSEDKKALFFTTPF